MIFPLNWVALLAIHLTLLLTLLVIQESAGSHTGVIWESSGKLKKYFLPLIQIFYICNRTLNGGSRTNNIPECWHGYMNPILRRHVNNMYTWVEALKKEAQKNDVECKQAMTPGLHRVHS